MYNAILYMYMKKVSVPSLLELSETYKNYEQSY